MRKTALTSAFCLLTTYMFSQDIHFSQFYQSPLTLNPALTAVGCDIRGIINYKNQWSSIADPYKTFAFSFEAGLLKRQWKNGYLGAGISAFNDRAGNSKMGLTQFNFSLSSIRKLDDKNILSAGLQSGYAQRSVITDNLHWNDQFSGTGYDPGIPSGENFSSKKISYGDYSAGILWSYGKGEMYSTANDELKMNMGISCYHATSPKISFYNEDTRLNPRIVLHGGFAYGIKNTNTAIVPSFMYAMQNPQQELIAGTLFRYRLKEDSKYTGFVKGSAISFGGYYRSRDALVLAMQLEISSYSIGISYDVNTSALNTASSGRGGLEISLRFISPNPYGGSALSSPSPKFNKH